ncbi:type II toxin-antitoxin system VapC family toxin [Nocardioides rubriscoriae]|nr:type II toxin-antitoxin system VapC family toxin [Nocardioides rubriscoriae]
MIVDTSALMSVLLDEDDAPVMHEAIGEAEAPRVSAGTLL